MNTPTRPSDDSKGPERVPRLFSVRALAAHWSFSRSAIYKAIDKGQLRAVLVLGRISISEADALDFLRRQGLGVRTDDGSGA